MEATEDGGGKERVAAVGNADLEAELEVQIEEGEIGSQADGEEEETEAAADGSGPEEKGAFERMGARRLRSAGIRGSWKGRGGRGRGGFHPRPWYSAK